MKFNKLMPLIMFLAATTGCSKPAHVQKDPSVDLSKYHTYMWVVTRANDQDISARPTAYIDLSMRNSVNQLLQKKGWKETDVDPDVLLSYEVLVEKTIENRLDPQYTQPFTRVFYHPFRQRWILVHFPSEFIGYQTYQVPVKEATITLTMVDANTDKVVWQGWTTETLNYSNISEKEIRRSANNLFKKFG